MSGNPFNYGMPVYGEQFVGRWEQIEEMAEDLGNPSGGMSHILVGGRRFGKSSFLETLQRKLIEQLPPSEPGTYSVFPVLVDLKSLPQSSASPEGVFAQMLRTLHRYFTSPLQRRKVGLTLELDVSQTQLAAFVASQRTACSLEQFSDIIENLVDLFFAEYGSPRFVFLLDEIDKILDQSWAKDLFDNSRSLLYANKVQDYVRYVLAGSSQTYEMRESKGSPFLNILNVVLLKAIDDDEIRKMINRVEHVPEDLAQAILQLCGGHPFLACYIMRSVWDSLHRGVAPNLSTIVNTLRVQRRNVDLEVWCNDVGMAGLVAYKVLAETHAWLTQWEIEQSIPDAQLRPLIGRALYSLCYHGLAIHDGSWGRYHMTGQLFGDWFTSEKVPALNTPTAPTAPPPPNAHTSSSDGKPVITYEILSIFPTAYWPSMKRENFPLVTLVIDNSQPGCANATFHIKATILGYSYPDIHRPFEVLSGSIERKSLLPILLQGELPKLTKKMTVPCHILVKRRIEQGWDEIYEETPDIQLQPIDAALLAMPDEGGKLRDVADYLAVFVTPKSPEVQNFVADAADPHDGLEGYQANVVDAGNVTDVGQSLREQARAFFDALVNSDLRYVFSPPDSTSQPGHIMQQVRFPFQVLPKSSDHAGQFSCLDISILFASLLENIGMQPLLVLIRLSRDDPAHAFIGWRIWKNDTHEISDFLDITMISKKGATFAKALAEGHRLYDTAITQKLDERGLYNTNGFMRIIDIAACRARNINPFI